jgi:hypothetical protein
MSNAQYRTENLQIVIPERSRLPSRSPALRDEGWRNPAARRLGKFTGSFDCAALRSGWHAWTRRVSVDLRRKNAYYGLPVSLPVAAGCAETSAFDENAAAPMGGLLTL